VSQEFGLLELCSENTYRLCAAYYSVLFAGDMKTVKLTDDFCTASFYLTNSTFCPHSLFMRFYGSQNKQRLFSYTTLTDWFLKPKRNVFTVRYELNL
jgi:hypothetical protein